MDQAFTITALLAQPATADLHKRLSERLQALAQRHETPAARLEADEAYATKWWHIRVRAIQCFAKWGGKANKRWLRERAERVLTSYRDLKSEPRNKALHWIAHETLAARSAILPLIESADTDWLLDLWFAERSMSRHRQGKTLWNTFEYWHGVYSLQPCIARLPADIVMQRIRAEEKSDTAANREASLILAWLVRSLPDRLEVLQRRLSDMDQAITTMARDLLRVEGFIVTTVAP
jgi:hypothetical protein